MVLISKASAVSGEGKRMIVDTSMFRVERSFAVGSAVICAILIAVYGAWW